jgi:hypothetical protein
MARRRRVGDGNLAPAFARLHGVGPAGLLGPWRLLSSAAYGLLYDRIGWRGLLLIGVLPALVIVYIRKYVKEPEIWIENRRKQRFENRADRMETLVFGAEVLRGLSRCPSQRDREFESGSLHRYPEDKLPLRDGLLSPL